MLIYIYWVVLAYSGHLNIKEDDMRIKLLIAIAV
jgi:hypothetical protein